MKPFSAICFIVFSLCWHVASAFGFNDFKPFNRPELTRDHNTLISYAFSVGRNEMHEIRVERFVHERWSLLYCAGIGMRTFSSGMHDVRGTEYRAPLGVSLGAVSVSAAACA